ncbi:MAG: thioredoxin family protein [Spirochaetales bacterium]|nr:thioredoxin family protein [Spirochaetales bacterium]
MAATQSTMRDLGTPAPDFSLPSPDGTTVSRNDFAGKPLLIGFICNHCPFVKHIAGKLGELTSAYTKKGVAVVLISSNDISSHPEDAPDNMPAFLDQYGIAAPYLYDETQEVAKAYEAACTPDFFLFDGDHKLFYRGQFDAARPGNDEPVTGEDLSRAVDAVLERGKPIEPQKPSMGCNIKWKPGNEPAFFSVR